MLTLKTDCVTLAEWLQRIWSLGPKRIGPNFLLSSETTSASLFSGSDAAVVRLSAKQEKKSASHPAQADLGGPGGPQVEDPALRPSELAEADAHSELSARVCQIGLHTVQHHMLPIVTLQISDNKSVLCCDNMLL